MDIVSEMCLLLEAEKNRFIEYEVATQALMDCTPDDAENYITVRGQKANEIDGIREEIAALCGQVEDCAVLLNCSKAALAFEKVPNEYHPVYYAAQGVMSVISRIRQSDAQALQHIEKMRDEALESIKQNQNMPKIKKYLTDLADTQMGGFTAGKA